MYVIKNISDHAVPLDNGVVIAPNEQLSVQTVTGPMNAALDRGELHLADGDPTPAELKSDADAIKPFKTGDPAIDG